MGPGPRPRTKVEKHWTDKPSVWFNVFIDVLVDTSVGMPYLKQIANNLGIFISIPEPILY